MPKQRRRGLRGPHVLLAATCRSMRALCGTGREGSKADDAWQDGPLASDAEAFGSMQGVRGLPSCRGLSPPAVTGCTKFGPHWRPKRAASLQSPAARPPTHAAASHR